jgi:hypothetical protein
VNRKNRSPIHASANGESLLGSGVRRGPLFGKLTDGEEDGTDSDNPPDREWPPFGDAAAAPRRTAPPNGRVSGGAAQEKPGGSPREPSRDGSLLDDEDEPTHVKQTDSIISRGSEEDSGDGDRGAPRPPADGSSAPEDDLNGARRVPWWVCDAEVVESPAELCAPRSPGRATDGYSPLPTDSDVDDAAQHHPLHPRVQEMIERLRGEERIAQQAATPPPEGDESDD